MGTELEAQGISLSGGKLWSAQLLLDNPAVLKAVHASYIKAGADVITTATYQASMEGFADPGVSPEQARKYIQLAVQLADEARNLACHQGAKRVLLGFSCGSYGASLCDGSEFSGNYAETTTEEFMRKWHFQRVEPILQDKRVDLLCFETVPCLTEVMAITKLLSSPECAHIPAWVSISCRDAQHTCHGELFAAEVVPLLAACPQVIGIGINCTNPSYLEQLLTDAKQMLTQLALTGRGSQAILLCYPNSGEEFGGDRCWHGTAASICDPDSFASASRAWVAAGAQAVGGCCRTGPAHIAALRQILLPDK